jgi:hypothetical protein
MGALEQVRLMVWHDVGDQPAPPCRWSWQSSHPLRAGCRLCSRSQW